MRWRGWLLFVAESGHGNLIGETESSGGIMNRSDEWIILKWSMDEDSWSHWVLATM